ncbi:MAG TPA: HAD-IC family P-type ATPase, partial [Planctomycetota bacterium]|nr:HAD-IC family P-type ATPase [Planctomycetota bacterium]
AASAAAARYADGTVAVDLLFDADVEGLLRARGLEPTPEEVHARDPEARALLVRMIAAVPLAAAVMALTMLHRGPSWLILLLALPVQFWAGWSFHAGFLRSLRHRTADMNALVSIGTNAAFFASPFLDHPWYDTSATIIAIVLVGRWLEARARRGTRRAVERLLEMAPRETVRPGDERTVKPGERFPADGLVLEGAGPVDESMLTGESRPVEKAPGARVFGGTINRTAALRVRFDRTGDDTMLARIVRLVRDTQGSKPAVQRLADLWAARFVPIVLLVALGAGAAWLLLDPGYALTAVVSILIVACPCAFGLATPAAIAVAAGRAARVEEEVDGHRAVGVASGCGGRGRQGAEAVFQAGDGRRVETADAVDDPAGQGPVPAIAEGLLEGGGPKRLRIDVEPGAFGGEVDRRLTDAGHGARGLLDRLHAAGAVHAADLDVDDHKTVVSDQRSGVSRKVAHRECVEDSGRRRRLE